MRNATRIRMLITLGDLGYSTMAKKTQKSDVKKIGIYLPEERVVDLGEYRERMNFSAIFWSAFDQEKRRLDCLPKENEVSEIVERLRKSKKEFEDSQRAEGQKEGAEWAAKTAEYEELVKLREFTEEQQRRNIDFDQDDVGALFPDYEFWETVLCEGHEPMTRAFVAGFVDSALEVFEVAEAQGL